MPKKPKWLIKDVVLAMHGELIAEHGGDGGVRDEGLLDSALARPQNLWAYGDPPPSLKECAAALCIALAKNHPFVDGNKRVALAASFVFLRINGWRLRAPEVEAVTLIQEVASGGIKDPAIVAAWFEKHCEKIKK